MTDPVDLLTRGAQKLCDLTDEALADFEESHGEQQRHRWPAAMSGWLGGPIGAYAAVVSHPTIGYALVDELRKTAATIEEHLPAWERLEANDRDSPRPYTVAELVGFHHGRMLAIARTVLDEA